jgi:hypothetical protein
VQKFERVEGNKEVVELLEQHLEEARKGMTSFAGVVTVEGNRFATGSRGDIRAFHVAFFAVDHLQNKMRNYATVAANPLADEEAACNKFLYDVSLEPICHDFIIWLVTAEMTRKREGIVEPLQISLAKRNDTHEWNTQRGMPGRDDYVSSVFLPAIDMFGAELNPVVEGRNLAMYTPKQICDWVREGDEVPRMQVPHWAMQKVADFLRGRTPVTITLRETTNYPHRNSNIDAWCKFADWLERKGEWVLFLRDTDKLNEPIPGFDVFSGTRDAFLRSALYEQSKCNCFVSNGPLGWALFGTKPFLAFHTIEDDERSECNTPIWWRRYQGIEKGEQWPWCLPHQRLIYADDNFDNMKAAWEEHMHEHKAPQGDWAAA